MSATTADLYAAVSFGSPGSRVTRKIWAGETVRVWAEFFDQTGEYATAGSVSMRVRAPDGTTYSYSGTDLSSGGTGLLYRDVTVSAAGTWLVRVACVSPQAAVYERTLDVLSSGIAADTIPPPDVADDTGGFLLVGTRDQAIATDIPDAVAWVGTAVGSAFGDGGGALYRNAETEPQHAAKFQSADGRWWEADLQSASAALVGADAVHLLAHVPPERHAEILDGISTWDAAPALRAALAEAISSNRRVLVLPPGRICLASADPNTNVYAAKLSGVTGLRIVGAGDHLTTLWSAPDANLSSFSLSECEDVHLSDFTVDVQQENQSQHGYHGIRGEKLLRCSIRRVRILNSAGYGIGLQYDSEYVSRFQQLLLEDVYIKDSFGDGLDIKNGSSLNSDIVLRRVMVQDPGRGDPSDPITGVDCRGPVNVESSFVKYTHPGEAAHCGFRVRQDDATHGIGGQFTSFTNCRVDGPETGSSILGFGIYNAGVKLTGCHASHCSRGFQTSGSEEPHTRGIAIIGCSAENCGAAFEIGGGSNNVRLIAPHARNCTGEGVRINSATATTIVAALIEDCYDGIRGLNDTDDVTVISSRVINCTRSYTFPIDASCSVFNSPEFAGNVDLWGASKAILLRLQQDGESGNYLSITNSDAPTLSAAGADENIPLVITSKGTGIVTFSAGTEVLRLRAKADSIQRLNITPDSSGGAVTLQAVSIDTDTSDTGRVLLCGSGTDGSVGLGTTTDKIGFFGAAAVAQPAVTGSRSGGAALQSLLSALHTLGLITNASEA